MIDLSILSRIWCLPEFSNTFHHVYDRTKVSHVQQDIVITYNGQVSNTDMIKPIKKYYFILFTV